MPDEQVSTPDMQEYGYSYDGMLPVTRERALELDAAGLTVYVLHKDNTESMVFDTQEIMEHGGLCGVDREEWEKSPQFHEKVMERQEHQQEREQAFLSQNRDCFAIYQVKHTDELRDICLLYTSFPFIPWRWSWPVLPYPGSAWRIRPLPSS